MANVSVAALFSLLWLLGGPPVDRELLWQPGVIAACLFVGQLSQFIALEKGDVSVAVPVFGLKVILVAFLTPYLVGEPVGRETLDRRFAERFGHHVPESQRRRQTAAEPHDHVCGRRHRSGRFRDF